MVTSLSWGWELMQWWNDSEAGWNLLSPLACFIDVLVDTQWHLWSGLSTFSFNYYIKWWAGAKRGGFKVTLSLDMGGLGVMLTWYYLYLNGKRWSYLLRRSVGFSRLRMSHLSNQWPGSDYGNGSVLMVYSGCTSNGCERVLSLVDCGNNKIEKTAPALVVGGHFEISTCTAWHWYIINLLHSPTLPPLTWVDIRLPPVLGISICMRLTLLLTYQDLRCLSFPPHRRFSPPRDDTVLVYPARRPAIAVSLWQELIIFKYIFNIHVAYNSLFLFVFSLPLSSLIPGWYIP